MHQYLLRRESGELNAFPHIIEFASRKINTIQFGSFKKEISDFLRFYHVADGCFHWIIQDQHYRLYPGDLAVIFPGQSLGGEKDILEIGSVSWVHIQLRKTEKKNRAKSSLWSRLSWSEYSTIERILASNTNPVISRFKEAAIIFQTILNEFQNQEIGYAARINQSVDDLMILTARQLTGHHLEKRDFPQIFMRLEQTLRENLSHQWTVDEMAASMGLGATSFSEKVRKYTGFSPLNYLINIRISEAVKLLKQSECSITDIAFDVGFYSSQHFATTFKKLTGYTPSEFRKNTFKDN